MTVFGDTDDLPSEIKKLHKEIDQLRNSSEFQPILTTGRSDDGYGASVGSKTMNSGGVWALTPVVHSVEKLTSGATTFDKIELISACVTVDVNTAQSNWQNITELEVKTLRMGSTNDPNASTVTNSAPNGAILFIKPVRGKTLTLKTGGNIHLSQDVTLDEKAFAILQFYVDATGTGDNEVNKKWVMLQGSGGSASINSIKEPCRVATTGNNALHPVYNVTIDGVTLVEGQRLLVKNQTTARDNGIYVCGAVVAGASTFTRATDFDNDSEVKSGTLVTINEGTANGNKVFMMTEDTNPIIVGTTAIYFTLVTAVDTSADYVWTGQHKFQGDPTGNIGDSNATHTVEFGNTGTDRIRFIGEITGVGDAEITDPDGGNTPFTVPNSDPSISMKCAIVMNTYDIYDLDKTVFSQAVSSTSPPMLNNWVGIQANTGEDTTNNSNPPSPVLNGMSLNVPATKEFFFKVGKGTAGEEAEGSNVHEAFTVSGDGIKLGDKISTPTGNGWLYLDGANMKAITGGATLNLSEVGTIKADSDVTWEGKHVWDNTTTWLGTYDTDSEKATNCHAKFQGDGLRHQTYNSGTGLWEWDSGYDDDSTQRVLEIGKYGSHEVKIIAEVTGEGDAIITDPDGSGSYTIPDSDPSISFKASLVMNTYTMYDLDTLVFSQGASTTTPPPLDNWVYIEANTGTSGSPTLTGMHYNVPTSKTHQFKVNGTEKLNISSDGIKLSGNSTPSSLTNGMMWLNSSDNKVYVRSNGVSNELGSGGGLTNPMATDLDMGGNMITDISLFGISNSSGTNIGSYTGEIDSGVSRGLINFQSIRLQDVTEEIATFTDKDRDGIDFKADLDMNTFDITNIDSIKFGTGTSSNDALTSSEYGIEADGGTSVIGIKYNVPSNKTHKFYVGGSVVATIDSTGLVGAGGLDATWHQNINIDLIPASNSNYDLGSVSKKWEVAFVESLSFGNYTIALPTTAGTTGQALFLQSSGNLGWSSIVNNPMTESLKFDGGVGVKSYDSQEITIQVTNDGISQGSEGAMQIPYKFDQWGSNSPTSSTIDGWFGNKSGCIGIYERNSDIRLYTRNRFNGWTYRTFNNT